MLECAVIGAGQAGLATSYHLSQLGVEHVVFERGRVAETWRTARWDSFHLNTPNWCTQLPGLETTGVEPDAFAPLAEVVDMLSDMSHSLTKSSRPSTRSDTRTVASFRLIACITFASTFSPCSGRSINRTSPI